MVRTLGIALISLGLSEGDKHFELSQDDEGNVILTVTDGGLDPEDPSEPLPDAFNGTAIPNIVKEVIFDAS